MARTLDLRTSQCFYDDPNPRKLVLSPKLSTREASELTHKASLVRRSETDGGLHLAASFQRRAGFKQVCKSTLELPIRMQQGFRPPRVGLETRSSNTQF